MRLPVVAAATAVGAAAAYRRLHPEDDLADEVAVVTGVSRGPGLLLATELAKRGCRLVLCARDRAELDRATARLRETGAQVAALARLARAGRVRWAPEAGIHLVLSGASLPLVAMEAERAARQIVAGMADRRPELKAALQERWAASVRERAQLAPRSIVPVLDAVLAEQRPIVNKIRSQIAPKTDIDRAS
jgi:NAD(P)-dependent dehydrogenase (short-subunit alcohol dehydrogenase family)